jgi:hypothetical protein
MIIAGLGPRTARRSRLPIDVGLLTPVRAFGPGGSNSSPRLGVAKKFKKQLNQMTDTSQTNYAFMQRPFPHLFLAGVLGNLSSGPAIAERGRFGNWKREEGSVHRFWSMAKTDDVNVVLGNDILRLVRHRSQVENHLGAINSQKPTADLLKLSDGDGLGFHDDAGIRAVRLIVKISQDEATSRGGELLLSNGDLETTSIYTLIGDTGLCFCTKAKHFHAISTVSGSPAIFLILQYMTAES